MTTSYGGKHHALRSTTPMYMSDNEAALDPMTREIRTIDFALSRRDPPIIKRQDATATMTVLDVNRFRSMQLSWNKGHGEPRRARKKKATPKKRKRSTKSKKAWVPRKKYLAAKKRRK